MQSTFFGSGGSTALTLVCRLHATSPTGTFKRCRRRISGTYRTKVDRMANFFLYYLLWCGSRPSIQQMKKSFRLRLIRGVQSTRFPGGSVALTLVCRVLSVPVVPNVQYVLFSDLPDRFFRFFLKKIREIRKKSNFLRFFTIFPKKSLAFSISML